MFGAPKHGTENVVWDRRLGDDVHAFDLWYVEPADERGSGVRRTLTCTVVPLRSSCPRLRVAPRDVADEVARAFGGEEVRLELEAFDRRFRVETEDVRFTDAFLDQRLMGALLRLPEGVSVDVNEDVLLLSAPLLPAEQVLVLFDTAVAIGRWIPRVVSSLFPRDPNEGRTSTAGSGGAGVPSPPAPISLDRRLKARDRGRQFDVSSAKWQATRWPERIDRRGGTSAEHASGFPSCSRSQHRVWNGHPEGGAAGLGISPRSTMRSRVASTTGSGIGTAESNATV
jgi:hypothetical protein